MEPGFVQQVRLHIARHERAFKRLPCLATTVRITLLNKYDSRSRAIPLGLSDAEGSIIMQAFRAAVLCIPHDNRHKPTGRPTKNPSGAKPPESVNLG
jgi:hypothetical protein